MVYLFLDFSVESSHKVLFIDLSVPLRLVVFMTLDAAMFGAYAIRTVKCLDRVLPLLTCADFLFCLLISALNRIYQLHNYF